LLGGKEEIVRKAAENLKKAYPRLNVAGIQHGYFAKRGEESDRIVEQVNTARPNILFVCFGMPEQEHWVRENLDRLNPNMILFGGSTIDYAAGKKRVAPVWMRSAGLEWFFRLMQEPRRLWKRYLLGNPLFMGRVLVQRIRGRRK
jgi:N-acetylglucosaminyldiphosphoundecaprenol N-acetyl-beta-D-mannosaminyltransferase